MSPDVMPHIKSLAQQILPKDGKKVLQGYTDLKNPFGGRNDRRRNDRGPRGERRGRQDRPERKEGGN